MSAIVIRTAALAIMLGASGCSAPNGAFGGDGPASSGDTTSAPTPATGGDDMPPPPATGDQGSTTTGDPPQDGGPTLDPSTGTDNPNDTETEGETVEECGSPDNPIEMTLSLDGEPIQHGSCNSVTEFQGMITVVGDILVVQDCPSSDCVGCGAVNQVQLNLNNTASLPADFAVCGNLIVFDQGEDVNNCEWAVAYVVDTRSDVPLLIVSNRVNTPHPSVSGIKPIPITDCTDQLGCESFGLGPVEILFEGDESLPPGHAGPLQVAPGLIYDVHNYMSLVTEEPECDFRVAWTAWLPLE